MKKRIIAAIMTVLMIAMSMPQFVMADTSEPLKFVATADAMVYNGKYSETSYGTTTSTALADNLYWGSTTPTRYYYYAFDLSGLTLASNEVISSAKVKLALANSKAQAEGTANMYIWNVDSTWNEAEITYSNQPLAHENDKQNTDVITATPDLIYPYVSSGKGQADPITASTFTAYEFDISSLVRDYVNGARAVPFSVAMQIKMNSSSLSAYAVTKETLSSQTGTGAFVTYIEVSKETLQEFSITSTTPADDATAVDVTEDITVTFSNSLDEDTVSASDITITNANGTVALADEDISVSGNTITISKELERYTDYTITISNISDTYGQSLSTPYSFSFSTNLAPDASASLIPIAGDIAIDYVKESATWTPAQYRLNQASSANAKPNDDKPNHSSGSTRYILIKLDISDVDGTKTLRDVAFSYTKTSAGMLQNASVYVVPNGNIEWTKASDFCLGVDTAYDYTADSAAFNARQTAIETYYNQVTAAMTESNLLDKCDIDAAANTTRTVDITSAVLAAKANAENYITLCIVGSDTTTIAGGKHTTYPMTVSAIQETPSFGVVSSSPANGGVMAGVNKPIELALATNITEATKGYIKLLKASDESMVTADVTINNNKVTITPSLLDDNTAYKVVFEAGLADTFGNTVTANTVALTFTSGIPFGVEPLKFTLDQSPVYTTATEAASYTAGDRVTAVSVVTNNSSDSRDAKIFIALYDNNTNTLLSVSAVEGTIPCDGTAVQFSASIDVPETAKGTCLKAFFWDVTNDSLAPLCVSKTIGQN